MTKQSLYISILNIISIKRICIYILTLNVLPSLNFYQYFTTNTYMKHKNTHATKHVTDILTFLNHSVVIYGNMVLSIERIIYNAHMFRINITREIIFLLNHGLIHLLGFDHNLNKYENVAQKNNEILLYTSCL